MGNKNKKGRQSGAFLNAKKKDLKSQSGGKAKGNGTNNHFISGTLLPKEYQKVFIERGYMRNYEKVFSLRSDARKRLIGVVDRNVFYILWFDEAHSMFPTIK